MKFKDYLEEGLNKEEFDGEVSEGYDELMEEKAMLLDNVTAQNRDRALQVLTIINNKINELLGKNNSI